MFCECYKSGLLYNKTYISDAVPLYYPNNFFPGYNYTRSTIKALNVVDHTLFSNVGVLFNDMVASVSSCTFTFVSLSFVYRGPDI